MLTEAESQKHIDEKHDGQAWSIYEEKEGWGFTVEPKIYLSSPHSTKIDTADKDKTLQWINKIMAEASIKPVPRFTLAKLVGTSK